ncbi:Calx-beta domain-containing protein [Sulfitobacter aestuarii]|uniref:Calx-beta domain-containing protein n=1 Tax=Sulfitobacter aestuarii TaxID=2161676 RepID=A0ABW5U6F4_9RHOB
MASIISVTPSSAIESVGSGFGGLLQFDVTLSEAASDAVTVSYRLFPGTALIDRDVPSQTGLVTFAPGELTQRVEFRARHDNTAEADESLFMEFYDPEGGSFAGDAQTLRASAFILDDDSTTNTRGLFVSAPVIVEGDTGTRQAVFDVTISEAFASTTSFDFATKDGSATAGEDYTGKTGQVTFAPGQLTAQVTVDITGDSDSEASEYFHLVVETDASIADGGAGSVGMARILDDDSGGSLPSISFEANGSVESIGSGFGGVNTFVVRLSEPSSDAVTVQYRSFPGTATNHLDYPQSDGTVTFAPGETWQVITIRGRHDNLAEADESFGVELYDPQGASLAGGAKTLRETVFIQDDDSVGQSRGLHVSSSIVVEGDSGSQEVLFDIIISRPSDVPLTFAYTTQDVGAKAGSDYTAQSGNVTFAPGQTRASVAIEVSGDTAIEPTEYVQLVLTPGSAIGDDGAGAVGELTILDDDAGGSLPSFSVSAGSAPESIGSGFGGVHGFVATLSEASSDVVRVGYRTLPATATAEQDFPRSTGVLEFAPGETSQVLEIRSSHDNLDEDDEAFVVEFFDISGAAFVGGAKVLRESCFIIDDDGVGLDRSLQVSSPVLLEGDGGIVTARFEVALSRVADTSVSFDYATQDGSATSGSDYVATSGTLTFLPGQSRAFVDVQVNGDTSREPAEFFQLVVTPTSALGDDGAGSVGTAQILDDDAAGGLPSLSISSHPVLESIGSGFGGMIDWVVTLSAPAVDEVSVNYRTIDATALGGTDFPEQAGVLVFAPGETSKTISHRVSHDNLDEADESLVLELFEPVGAALSGNTALLQKSAFILDDDGVGLNRAVHVSDVQLYEPVSGSATATFEITLSRPFDSATTLSYETIGVTATAGADFTAASGAITFQPGQTSAAVNIEVKSDGNSETAETFLLSLLAPLPATITGAPEGSLGTATILAPPNSLPTGAVVIGGNATEGATLTALTGGIDDADGLGSFTYQWSADGSAISGATGASFSPGQDEVGAQIRVIVSYVDGGGTAESLTSAPTGVITNNNNAPTGTIGISGTLQPGATLTADTSGIGDADGLGTLSYQWLRGGSPIAGATGASYAVKAADIGSVLGLRVSYTDGFATPESLVRSIGKVPVPPGTAGNDLITGGPLADLIEGGAGDDTLSGADGDDSVLGQVGHDSLLGGPGDDVISAFDGNDFVDGGAGNDMIGGGLGDDTLRGSEGNDTIGAGFGDDVIEGGDGHDVAAGGAGNDLLIGGLGNDTMGGSYGTDTLRGSAGDDSLGGGTGRDLIDGGAGHDAIGGGEGDDTIDGGAGHDFLAGGGRDDSIDGGSGNDTINGGAGNDTVSGGDGADLFVFNEFLDGDTDLILGFEDGLDSFRMIGVENAPGSGLAGYLDALDITETLVEGVAGVQLSYQGQTILVSGVSAAQLGLEDFTFL